MKIQNLFFSPYKIKLKNGMLRFGALVSLEDTKGNKTFGDIAPLPGRNKETLSDALGELRQKKAQLLDINFTKNTVLEQLSYLNMLPSVAFGLESALLASLFPLPEHLVQTSALLMGTVQEILAQAILRKKEGYTTAKVKVSNLTFKEAEHVIQHLKTLFHLRIDVNRAWKKEDALHFFASFPLDAFDYIEEPFQNPHDLKEFSHPLAIDESFPKDLSLQELEALPTLKALVYKPTVQGGMANLLPVHSWAKKRGVFIVLENSLESSIGVGHVASLAHRLSLDAPIGIGAYQHLEPCSTLPSLLFFSSFVKISTDLLVEREFLIV